MRGNLVHFGSPPGTTYQSDQTPAPLTHFGSPADPTKE